MSNIVPHSTCLFNAVTLCLRRDGIVSYLPQHDWEISAGRACDYLTKLGRFLRDQNTPELFPNPLELRIIGAEPFSRIGELEKITNCAKANKMISHVWTTGHWAADVDTAAAALDRLKDNIHAVTLHTGAEAIEKLGLPPLERLLRALSKSRLGCVIECVLTPASRLPLELFALEILNSHSSFIRIVPAAWAIEQTPQNRDFFLSAPPRYDRCAERFSFTILPNADVYPCLRSIGAEAMILGSLTRQSVDEILDIARQSAPLARLRNEGPSHLVELAKSAGDFPGTAQFADSCQLHRNLLERLKQCETPRAQSVQPGA